MKLLFISTVCVIVLTHSAVAQCHYRVTILPTLDCGILGQDGGTPMALNDYGQVAGKHSHCLADGESPFAWTGGPTIGTIPLPPGVVSAQAYAINNVLGSNGIGMVGGEALTSSPTPYRPFIWFNGQWQFLSYGQNTSPGGVLALNDHGMAVGYTGGPLANVATIWIDGQPIRLTLPFGPRSYALAVNQPGAVVGWMGNSDFFDSHAYLWVGGQTTDLGVVPGGFTGSAIAINRRNQIVVRGRTEGQDPDALLSRIFLWEKGNWTEIGMLPGYNTVAGVAAINERSEVVGFCSNTTIPGNPGTAWLWRRGGLSDLSTLILPGSGINQGVGGARSINNEGQIIAQASVGSSHNLTGVSILLTPVPDRAGDTNCDGTVNIDDLVNVITRWGPCPHSFCSADLDQNGVTNILDLVAVLQNWDFLPPN